jgi:urease accessory protein
MNTSAFLFALQLADSALPTGRFAHSYGLEELVAREPDLDRGALTEIVESMLLEVVAPLDGAALAQAHRLGAAGDVDGLVRVDRAVTCRKLTPASRHASTACGSRIAALASTLTGDRTALRFAGLVAARQTDGNLPIVEGVLARALGVGLEEAILLELRGTSVALVSAALRLGRISATQAQFVIAFLVPTMCDALEIALSVPVNDMRAFGPELDIMAVRHGRREARLFVT